MLLADFVPNQLEFPVVDVSTLQKVTEADRNPSDSEAFNLHNLIGIDGRQGSLAIKNRITCVCVDCGSVNAFLGGEQRQVVFEVDASRRSHLRTVLDEQLDASLVAHSSKFINGKRLMILTKVFDEKKEPDPWEPGVHTGPAEAKLEELVDPVPATANSAEAAQAAAMSAGVQWLQLLRFGDVHGLVDTLDNTHKSHARQTRTHASADAEPDSAWENRRAEVGAYVYHFVIIKACSQVMERFVATVEELLSKQYKLKFLLRETALNHGGLLAEQRNHVRVRSGFLQTLAADIGSGRLREQVLNDMKRAYAKLRQEKQGKKPGRTADSDPALTPAQESGETDTAAANDDGWRLAALLAADTALREMLPAGLPQPALAIPAAVEAAHAPAASTRRASTELSTRAGAGVDGAAAPKPLLSGRAGRQQQTAALRPTRGTRDSRALEAKEQRRRSTTLARLRPSERHSRVYVRQGSARGGQGARARRGVPGPEAGKQGACVEALVLSLCVGVLYLGTSAGLSAGGAQCTRSF